MATREWREPPLLCHEYRIVCAMRDASSYPNRSSVLWRLIRGDDLLWVVWGVLVAACEGGTNIVDYRSGPTPGFLRKGGSDPGVDVGLAGC